MKQIAIYVRVSTNAQDTASQLADLKQWASSRSGVVWHEDKCTGKTMDRPAWANLAADIATGKVGTVAVWRLDRLGRTASGLTALFDELCSKKVNLVSLKDGLDLSTPAGRLMANVLASVAQFETEVRGERVRAGQKAALAKGKRWGGSKPGVRKKVTTTKADAIKHLFKAGESITAIAKSLTLSRPTIYDVLREAGLKS